jgi:hypothetical protein
VISKATSAEFEIVMLNEEGKELHAVTQNDARGADIGVGSIFGEIPDELKPIVHSSPRSGSGNGDGERKRERKRGRD